MANSIGKITNGSVPPHMSSPLKETLSALEALAIRPSKRLGQNFLIDGNVVGGLLSLFSIGPGDAVVEVGPGLGTISEKILSAGARLFAVEIDRRLCDFLWTKFGGHGNFHLLHGDAVDFPVGPLPNSAVDFAVVANLPYAISSPWMDALLGWSALPRTMALIVQDEVASRFFAADDPSQVCPISIFLRSAYGLIHRRSVPRTAFFPMPVVASAMVAMERKAAPFTFHRSTKRLIRRIFTGRRKQIAGIGRAVEAEWPTVGNWLTENEISPRSRPEEIPLAMWQALDSSLRHSAEGGDWD